MVGGGNVLGFLVGVFDSLVSGFFLVRYFIDGIDGVGKRDTESSSGGKRGVDQVFS